MQIIGNFRRYFILVILLLTQVTTSQGTHIVGGEFNYQYLGNNVYRIWLTVYRDCYNGIPPFDNPASVGIYDAVSNVLVKQIVLDLTGSDTIPPTINSPCFIPPNNICYERTTYTDTVTLPPITQGYVLSYQRCCRNYTILNIINPEATGATYTASIPGTSTFSQNSNPRYKNWPPPFICAGIPFVFDHSAIDAEGDSIVYELCAPFEGADTINPMPSPPAPPPYADVNWKSPYNAGNILNGNPTLAINAQTGELTCMPNTIGQFVVGVCAKEFRNGIFLSITKRDFQLNVVPCPSYVVAAIQNPIINCNNYEVFFQNFSLNAGSYLWDFGLPGNTDISTDVNPLFTYPDTGVYTVTLIAYSSFNPNCADTTIGTVTILPNFQTYAFYLRDTCSNTFHFNDSSGVLSGSIALHHWDFGDGNTSTLANPQHLYTTAGNYVVTLITTSSRGCTDTVAFTVTAPELVHITTVSSESPVCNGDCNASITVQHSGGTAPFSYLWSDPYHQTSNSADSLCAGNYQLIISDKNGCTTTANYIIINPSSITQQTITTSAYCHGACFGTASTLVNGGVPGYSYAWSDPNNQSLATAVNLCEGTYQVTITDNNGCSISALAIINYSDSIPSVDATADHTQLFYGQSTLMHAIPDVSGATYSWTPTTTLNNALIANPTASPIDTTVYVVLFTDKNGCSNTDSIKIQIRPVICEEPEIFIPNAFSPNHDNNNEVLYVRGNTISKMDLKVYDRWGELVFISNDPSIGWDGTYNGKAVDPGVFDYYLKITCYNKEDFFKKGNITLIR